MELHADFRGKIKINLDSFGAQMNLSLNVFETAVVLCVCVYRRQFGPKDLHNNSTEQPDVALILIML